MSELCDSYVFCCMRLLALQTDLGLLKKQLIPEGENEIMTVSKHPVVFVFDAVITTIIAAVLLFVLGWMAVEWNTTMGTAVTGGLFLLAACVYVYRIFSAYVTWRFNYVIITSEKVVIVDQSSWRQNMDSIHLNSIVSVQVQSQFFGLLRCGIIQIRVGEIVSGQMRAAVLTYTPNPDTVVSAIEHAMALKQRRKQGMEEPEEQQSKAEAIKEELKQEAGNTQSVAPSDVPAAPPETPPAPSFTSSLPSIAPQSDKKRV